MAKFNPDKYNWNALFTSKLPVLPPELTKKWWNDTKSTIAKSKGKTGMGPALAKVETAFKAIPWTNLAYNPHVTKQEEGRDDIVNFCKSAKFTNLVSSLKDVEKLAKTIIAKNYKSKLIPKKDKTAAADVLDWSSKLASYTLSTNGWSEALEKSMKAYAKKKSDATVKKAPSQLKTAQGVVNKLDGKLKEFVAAAKKWDSLEDDAKSKVGSGLFTLTRDMSQQIVNITKAHAAGVKYDNLNLASMQKLGKEIVPYSNAQDNGASFKRMTAPKIAGEIKTIATLAISFKKNFKGLKISYLPPV